VPAGIFLNVKFHASGQILKLPAEGGMKCHARVRQCQIAEKHLLQEFVVGIDSPAAEKKEPAWAFDALPFAGQNTFLAARARQIPRERTAFSTPPRPRIKMKTVMRIGVRRRSPAAVIRSICAPKFVQYLSWRRAPKCKPPRHP